VCATALLALLACPRAGFADNGATVAAAPPPSPATPPSDQPPASELELFNLERVLEAKVQSATLTASEIETVPSIVTVITQEQIRDLNLRTLRDALMLVTGVTVIETPFNDQQVAVRGIYNPANILVTLDGERLNDFYDGAFFADLPLDNIERIEVIRGPGSALYGTNAFSGVISLYTKEGAQTYAGSGGEAYFDHQVGWGVRAHAGTVQVLGGGNWTVRAFGSVWSTNGPKVEVERDNAGAASFSTVRGLTNGAKLLSELHLSIARKHLLTARDRLELWGTFLFKERGPYFGPHRVFAPNGSDIKRSAMITYLDYQLPLPRGLTFASRLTFDRRDANYRVQDRPENYFNDANGNFMEDPGEVFPEGELRQYRWASYRVGLRPQVTWELQNPRRIAGNSLVAGAELQYEWLPVFSYAQNFMNGLYVGRTLANYDNLPLVQKGKDRLQLSAFVQDQLRALKTLWITVGLRVDYFADFGAAWNPRAAVVWKPWKRLSLKLLYGRAFRAPTFQELYDQTNTLETPSGLTARGNPKLRPETTDTVEAGVEVAALNWMNLRANGFYIRTSDLIDLDPTFNFTGGQLINYPGREIGGVEGDVQLNLDKHNYFHANVSWFQTTKIGSGLPGSDMQADRRFLAKEMRDTPRLRFNAVLVGRPFNRLRRAPATFAAMTASLAYSFVDESRNNARVQFESLSPYVRPAYHELSAALTFPFGKVVELVVSCAVAINKTIPIVLTSGWYELPANQANVFAGVRLHL
jgi:outer membrane receptor protein involved in Fe transport